jgi:ribokinase
MQRARIEVAKALLLQCEVPLDTVIEAIRIANRAKVPVVFNPSPCLSGFPWGEVEIDYLIVNRAEAEQIFGRKPVQVDAHADFWGQSLKVNKVRHLIVTRGAESTLLIHDSTIRRVATHKVKPVDTVGAGDTFAGAFVTHMAEGASLLECVRWANTAAALSTLHHGAQGGIPLRGEVQSALAG